MGDNPPETLIDEEQIRKAKKPRNKYDHYYCTVALLRKLRLLTNAYLMVSYENDSEGKRWVSIECIQQYMAKVQRLSDMATKYGHKAILFAASREEEIRATWYRNLRTNGCTMDMAIRKSLDEKWPDERELGGANGKTNVSGEFSTPTTGDKNKPTWPIPAWKSQNQTVDRAWRWRNMKHTLCRNHQNGVCQYTADECNRAHGTEYLQPKQTHKGKGKDSSNVTPKPQPYPSKGKGKKES